MDTLDIESSKKPIKPRNPLISALLSVLSPGLGQIYNGQFSKGIIFYFLPFFFLVLMGFTRISINFSGFLFLFVCTILFRLFCIVDAVWWSRKLKIYYLKAFNFWYYYLLILGVMFGGNYFIKIDSLLGIQTFSIPTTSHEPTIIPGDLVVADLQAYNERKIDYGEIALYKSDIDEFMYCRVVGLEGDEIEIKNGRLIINGKLCHTEFTRDKSGFMPVSLYQEILPNGHKHEVQFIRTSNTSFDFNRNLAPIIVPTDSYYLIGDFRDNSVDSRTIGCVTKDRIKGQIRFSYWGTSFNRIGLDFTKQ